MNDNDYMVGLNEIMSGGDYKAVEHALNAELAIQRNGLPYSQMVIDTCQRWLQEHDFLKHAGKGPAPCSVA